MNTYDLNLWIFKECFVFFFHVNHDRIAFRVKDVDLEVNQKQDVVVECESTELDLLYQVVIFVEDLKISAS